MTNNNFDEFDADQDAVAPAQQRRGAGANLGEAWRTQPLFKLIVIIFVVAIGLVAALSVFGGPDKTNVTQLPKPPSLNEPPGGTTTQAFVDQNDLANQQRAQEALASGGSAIPTPVGQQSAVIDLTTPQKDDPLIEFRAETERLRQELQQQKEESARQIQLIQQPQQAEQQKEFDTSLAQAMQAQMEKLNTEWQPKGMKVVSAPADQKLETQGGAAANTTLLPDNSAAIPPAGAANNPTVVAAGTVNYAQMLTEANSDVPGPILAQIVSGPLAGGRAVGRFQVVQDYLVLSFNLVTLNGKDYPVNAIALDPDTTLGGMATEVDQRYFSRLILPAAAAFMSELGSTLGDTDSTTTVSDGVVVVDQTKRGLEDGMYAGLGKAGETVGEFFQEKANQTKPLVRVASGTPLGIFFLTTVKENVEEPGYGRYGQGMNPSPYGTLDPSILAGMGQANPYAMGINSGLQGYTGYPPAFTNAYGSGGYPGLPSNIGNQTDSRNSPQLPNSRNLTIYPSGYPSGQINIAR